MKVGTAPEEKDSPPVAVLRFFARLVSVVFVATVVLGPILGIAKNLYCSYQLDYHLDRLKARGGKDSPPFLIYKGEGRERRVGYYPFPLGPWEFRNLESGEISYEECGL